LTDERWWPTQPEVRLSADVDWTKIVGGELSRPYDSGCQQHDHVGLLDRLIVVREELLDHRQVHHPWDPRELAALLLLKQSG
jgi:hypothetical protein